MVNKIKKIEKKDIEEERTSVDPLGNVVTSGNNLRDSINLLADKLNEIIDNLNLK